MAKKRKIVRGKLEKTTEKIEMLSEGELTQKKEGLEKEISVLQAALVEVNTDLAVFA